MTSAIKKLKNAMAAKRTAEQAERSSSGSPVLKRHKALLNKAGVQYGLDAEMDRIVSLPFVPPMTEEEEEQVSRDFLQASAFEDGFRLKPAQANGVLEYSIYNGLFAPIGVGQGKTLLSLLIASIAYQKGIEKILLLIPPQVVPQLVGKDIQMARTHISVPYPIHVLAGRGKHQRLHMARSKKKGLYVMPYSYLSVADTDEMLEEISAGLIIADEAHRVAHADSARSGRLFRYIDKAEPEMVVMSGTMTKKSLEDYFRLSKHSLKQNNFIPNTKSYMLDWAGVLDAKRFQVDAQETTGNKALLAPLVEWAQNKHPEEEFTPDTSGFRKAFRMRLSSCPGVVTSGDGDIGTSLILENEPVKGYASKEGWDKLQKLLKDVEEAWITPNGDTIEHAIHTWKWIYELSAGFYNELVWPTTEVFAARRRISESEAEDILMRAKMHHAADQDFVKILKRWLTDFSKSGLDTPLLVRKDISLNGPKNVGTELYQAWQEKELMDFEGRPDRDSNAVRVCSYKIDEAIARAKKFTSRASDKSDTRFGKGGILWYYHQEVGNWLFEKAKEEGLDAIHCSAGDYGNRQILDEKNRHKIMIASIQAHGEGKNLQHFQNQVFVQWPRGAGVAEQVLGRLHRLGQVAEELFVSTMHTLECDKMNFAACISDAMYTHQSIGVGQKLIYGTYNPLPEIFPMSVMVEKGLVPHALDEQQREMMKEKFG